MQRGRPSAADATTCWRWCATIPILWYAPSSPRAPSRDTTREHGGSMTRHLLVTNDFPPKIGGIQSYLWELWRRLPAESFAVYCTPHRGAAEFDRAQPFRIIRSPEPVLLPYPWLAPRIDELADELDASLVMLDPAVPLGVIGPQLR